MGITLKELADEGKRKYQMSLRGGHQGLSNQVIWIHTIEDAEAANFLHGGELVFTTGIAHGDEDWICDFIENLYQANAVGLVLNTGPYIKKINKDVIDLCNKLNFPIFDIPWEVRLVDVTKNFCDKIIQNNKREESVGELFKDYVHNKSNDAFLEIKNRGFDLNGDYLIYGFKIEEGDNSYHYENQLKNNIHQAFLSLNLNTAHFTETSILYYIVEDLGVEQERLLNIKIEEIPKVLQFKTYVSRHNDSIFNLSTNYAKLNTLIHSKYDEDFNSFDELGVEKILLAVSSRDELKSYYRNIISPLVEYDRKHDTTFCDLLAFYINHNGSLQQVANEFYLHKNTINYQLKKIGQIIGLDISSFENRVQLYIVFKIEKLIN